MLTAIALGLPLLSPQKAEAASPSDLKLVLTQSSTNGEIGTELTIHATLSVPEGALPEPPGGWFIEIRGSADGGWSSGPIQATNGQATYQRTSQIGQVDEINAQVVNAGCTGVAAEPIQHEWLSPKIVIDEAKVDTGTNVGETFELTGVAMRGTQAVSGADVVVDVETLTSDTPKKTLRTTTSQDGRFSVSWESDDAGIEQVTITATGAGGFSATTVTSHAWSESDADATALTLTADTEPRVGDPVEVTAELFDDLSPVDFWDDTNIDQPWVESFTQRPFGYASPAQAGWKVAGVRSTDGHYRGLAVYWADPTVSFVAPNSRSVINSSYPATVVVADHGRPVSGVRLLFRAGSEAATPYGSATTDADGRASAPYSRDTAGSTTIYVTEAPPDPGPNIRGLAVQSTSTTHTWLSIPGAEANLSMTSPSESDFESHIGTRVQFTAHLADDGGNPMPNWDVDFYLDGEEPLGTVATNAAGDASITLSRSEETFVSIGAAVVIGCQQQPLNAWAYHYWWESQLTLTPKAAHSPARRNETFTAEVARTYFGGFGRFGPESLGSTGGNALRTSSLVGNKQVATKLAAEKQLAEKQVTGKSAAGKPVSAAAIPEGMVPSADQPVRFTLTSRSCDLPVAVRQATTNDDGIAQVRLTRSGPGVDNVRAEEVGVALPVSDATTHQWTPANPAPQSIRLSQSSASSRAGSSVTVTATVRDTDRPNGRAKAGTPVTFLGTSPSKTVRTNSQGVARLTYTGKGTSPDNISATAPYGCGVVVSPTIRHRWYVPDLVLSPSNATSTTGQQASVTARLTHGSHPVSGQRIRLTIDDSTSGVSTETSSKETDSDGEATFAWTRSVPGTDKLTATELVDVQPQRDTAKHSWEAPPTTPPPVTVTEPPASQPPVTEPPPDHETPPSDEPSEKPTPKPTEKPTTQPTEDLPASSTMVDGPEVGRPGGDIQLSGTGCKSGEQLTVHLGDKELGSTRAAADGTFYVRAAVPDLPLGRYVIHSSCGTTIGDPNVDITAPQVDRAGGSLATAGLTTGSILVFFVLVAKGVISFVPRRPY